MNVLHRWPTLLSIALTVACCGIATLPAIADEIEQVGRDEIQARVAKWRASFVNVRVIYELRSLPPLNEPLVDWPTPSDPGSAPQFAQNEWIWADHGLDLLDGRSFYWSPGKVGYRSIDVFNGPKQVAFRASYQRPHEETEVLKELTLAGMVAGKPTSMKSRVAMRGLYWPATAEWLPDLLARWEWKVEGIETVLGVRCVKIAASYPMGNTDTNIDNLWLDLEHDYLPRRYFKLPNSVRTIGTDFVVDELQQLEGGLWFPKRARVQLQTDPVQNQLIVVTKAEINQVLDVTRFDPPAPMTGTLVTDARTGQVYRHGEQPTAPTQASKPNTPADAGGPLSAVLPASWGAGWTIAMICASVALLAVGLWLRLRDLRD